MSRTENVELAVVCLLEDGGRALLQNRKKEDWHGWALPGGISFYTFSAGGYLIDGCRAAMWSRGRRS